MPARWLRRSAVLCAFVLPVVAGPLPAARADAGGFQIKPIGNPTWRPVDCALFAAPIGTAATGYAEAFETVTDLLPAPNHIPRLPLLAIGPGAAHLPPYDSEIADGVRAEGFHQGHGFAGSEFSDGSGVFLACMAVPDPGSVGSSPDFASGPILPNSTFPIHAVAEADRDGAPFDPALASFDVPPLTTAIDPSFDVDGHSHFPLFVVTSEDFGPSGTDLKGRYVYSLTMTDTAGDGWMIRARFVIR